MQNSTIKYIPALKYHWLTGFFDRVIRITLPERQFRTALVLQAKIQPNQRVLDFGAGTAALSLLAKQIVPQAEVTGVDIDRKIIGIAKQKIKAANVEIRIDHYDGLTLPYADGCFDKVISSLVFHHLTRERKESSLNEIRRVLKRGGELHVADWGEAQTFLDRVLFLPVQMFDGFETTTDNTKGLLPPFMTNAGFVDVAETMRFSTVFGPCSLYQAVR